MTLQRYCDFELVLNLLSWTDHKPQKLNFLENMVPEALKPSSPPKKKEKTGIKKLISKSSDPKYEEALSEYRKLEAIKEVKLLKIQKVY